MANTLRDLIAEGVEVSAVCQNCERWKKVDLRAMARKLGPDFLLMDRLPLCEVPGRLGVVRFRAARGLAGTWLMTETGNRRLRSHGDWLFQTQQMIQSGKITVIKMRDAAGGRAAPRR